MKNLRLAISSSSADQNSMYSFKNPRPQDFDIPFPIIKYIIKNPTGKAWKNLIKTCKYLFVKNNIFPVDAINKNGTLDVVKRIINYGQKKDTIKIGSKIWFYDSFEFKGLYGSDKHISACIIQISKFDLQKLHLRCQDLSFEEYQILTCSGTIKDLSFFIVSIKYADGSKVTADAILDNLPNLETVHLDATYNKVNSITKIIEILSNSPKLRKFQFIKLDESFDFAIFSDFLMNNENVSFELGYSEELSDVYKRMLENFMEKVMKSPLKRTPLIDFPGMDEAKLGEYKYLFFIEVFFTPFGKEDMFFSA